jgi:peptide deformylase
MTQQFPVAQPIAQLGSAILREKAQAVSDIFSKQTQNIIDQMLTTVASAGGMGIAAPQINISQRIFVICSRPNKRYPNAPQMKATAMINPEIIKHSADIEKDWEGCLSVPALRGLVPRYQQIDISYFDRDGLKQSATYDGFLARVFQHELDHLNGLTFVDRLDSTTDLYSESEWYKQFVD